jgi:hypothetical protein
MDKFLANISNDIQKHCKNVDDFNKNVLKDLDKTSLEILNNLGKTNDEIMANLSNLLGGVNQKKVVTAKCYLPDLPDVKKPNTTSLAPKPKLPKSFNPFSD